MPAIPFTQPSGRLFSIPVRAHSITRIVSEDTRVAPPSSLTRKPVTRRTMAPLAAATSSERPQQCSAERPESTTESLQVKRVRTDSFITTVSSSATPAVAVTAATS